MASKPVVRKQLLERGGHVDLAHPSIGLRRHDPELSAGEVDIAPAQVERLADPQPSQDQNRKQWLAAAAVASALLFVHLCGGLQQGRNLFGLQESARRLGLP